MGHPVDSVGTQITQCNANYCSTCPSRYNAAVLWCGQWSHARPGAQHRDVSPVSRPSTLRPARPSRPAQETGLILLGFSLILLAS